MSEFDWNWPDDLDHAAVEDALKLRFLNEGANLVIVGPYGLGKTMTMENIAHQAILAGHSVLFVTAAKCVAPTTWAQPTKCHFEHVNLST